MLGVYNLDLITIAYNIKSYIRYILYTWDNISVMEVIFIMEYTIIEGELYLMTGTDYKQLHAVPSSILKK